MPTEQREDFRPEKCSNDILSGLDRSQQERFDKLKKLTLQVRLISISKTLVSTRVFRKTNGPVVEDSGNPYPRRLPKTVHFEQKTIEE